MHLKSVTLLATAWERREKGDVQVGQLPVKTNDTKNFFEKIENRKGGVVVRFCTLIRATECTE